MGQVESGKKYWYDGTPVAGQQFEYGFDDIGNRKNTEAGGDENGANLRLANYTNNSLNQITSRGVPGYVDVMGVSFATNTVTVNSQTAYRKGEYFRKELPVNNGSASLWTNIIVAATGQTSVTGNVFVAKAPVFGYDADGNMTNDGRWSLAWDAENRLTKAESLSIDPLASKRKVVWEFDAKGRRIRQTTSDGSSGSYVVTEDLKFLSDGWWHIAELNATNNALVRSYVWGLDLSESMEGAGGVGGLLMLTSVANGVHFYAYDGNGNVTALGKATDGIASANYEYDPFGSVVRATGAMATENRFQFSTKPCDRTTDFALYEFRVLRTDMGWLSRDPAEDYEFASTYAFVNNNALDGIDSLGLWRFNWNETDALKQVKQQESTWRKKGWFVAANFLAHFYLKAGPASRQLRTFEIPPVKKDPKLRSKIQSWLHSAAQGPEAENRRWFGPYPMRWIWGDGQMFRAFGGAQITLCGLFEFDDWGNWKWQGYVTIRDHYIYLKDGDHNWPFEEGDTYRAAYYLQTLLNKGYAPFQTLGTWSDNYVSP